MIRKQKLLLLVIVLHPPADLARFNIILQRKNNTNFSSTSRLSNAYLFVRSVRYPLHGSKGENLSFRWEISRFERLERTSIIITVKTETFYLVQVLQRTFFPRSLLFSAVLPFSPPDLRASCVLLAAQI